MPRDDHAFVGYYTRSTIRFSLANGVLTCGDPAGYRAFIAAMGVVFGPGLTVIAIVSRARHEMPLLIFIILILVNAIGWLTLAESLSVRRCVLLDFPGRRVVRRTRIIGIPRDRIIGFDDVQRFLRTRSERRYPADRGERSIDPLHLFAVKLTDGRVVQLLESTDPQPIDSITRLVEQEAPDVPLLDAAEEGAEQ
jgi:hypothetical protein